MSAMTFGAAQATARSKGLTLKNLKWSGKSSKDATYLYMEKYTSVVLDNVVASSMGLYCEGCHATVRDSTFANVGTELDNEKMDEGWGYLAVPSGGDSSADNSWPLVTKLEVTNSTFSNQYLGKDTAGGVINTAVSNNGGAPVLAHFTDCTFTNATNLDSNGGVFSVGYAGVMTFNRCVFRDCTSATNGGAGSVAAGGLLLVQDSVFEGNSATLSGGGIYSAGTDVSADDVTSPATAVNLKGVTLRKNKADNGGAIQVGVGSSLVLRASTLSANAANYGGTGGAVAVGSNGAEFIAVDSMLIGNTALGGSGGAVYATSDYASNDQATPLTKSPGSLTSTAVDMVNCTLQSNVATTGGGIYATFLSLSLRCVALTQNAAYAAGGGASLSSNLGGAFAFLEDTVVDGNAAPSGAGLSVSLSTSGAVAARRCAVSNNKASSYGGGMAVTYGLPRNAKLPRPLAIPLDVVNCSFSDNDVTPISRVEAGHGGEKFYL